MASALAEICADLRHDNPFQRRDKQTHRRESVQRYTHTHTHTECSAMSRAAVRATGGNGEGKRKKGKGRRRQVAEARRQRANKGESGRVRGADAK
jgi:hypothetical protein